MPFQIGACHTSAHMSRERVRRTRSLRPSAIQIILPDWFIPSWPELVVFIETIALEAAPIPLVIYNPPHAKLRLSPEEWLRLTEVAPAIAGIKVAGGDDGWYREMRPVFERVSVFVPGHTLATGLEKGARGAYSNVACLSPSGAQRWYEICRTNMAEGLRWERNITIFWKSRVGSLITDHGLSNMAADKAAAVAGGWLPGLSGRLRWPYRGATAELTRQLGMIAHAEVPELFST